MSICIPENAIITKKNEIKSAGDIVHPMQLKDSDWAYRITTDGGYQLTLFGNETVKMADKTVKTVENMRPNDELLIHFNYKDKYGEGVDDTNIPVLLGMTLIARMNNVSLRKYLKDYETEFVNALNSVEKYILEHLKEDKSTSHKINAFYRYCNTGMHIIPDIINKFTRAELLTFVKTLLKIYKSDYDKNNYRIIITHDSMSAMYLASLFRKVGIKAMVKTISEQYGFIYEIYISKFSTDELIKNTDWFKNNMQDKYEKVTIHSIINIGKQNYGYTIKKIDTPIIINDVVISY